MEKALMRLMSKKCQAMTDEKTKCFKKGKCDGQCAVFNVTLFEIEDIAKSKCKAS